MSQYTTGEIAKRCGVSVRTVQYYDSRGILVPSALSEGGRRLYSQGDVARLELICFLRSLELPIDSIARIFSGEHPEKVLQLMLQEQESRLRRELAEKQSSVERICGLKKTLSLLPEVSPQSIRDAAHIMENRKHLRNLRITMLILGFVMDAIEVSTLMLGILRGIWWPFCLGLVAVIALGVGTSALYIRRTVYICPECHTIFRPRLRDSLFARHTPNARKLTCVHCGHHGYCVETYGKEAPNA